MTIQDTFLEKIPLPDSLYRIAIRKQLKQRLKSEHNHYKSKTIEDYVNFLNAQPIAAKAEEANDQHYEVPVTFFENVMGKYKKYSCCLFETGNETLDEAEEAMLHLTCERAKLLDGQHILELGCGWGSLTLYMAKKFPKSKITAVSNSHSQREFIEQKLLEKKLQNVTVLTQNVATLTLSERVDRIISIEMMEHIRNYEKMFHNIARWLKKNGKVFIHIFGHKTMPYIFDDTQEKSWMAKHFFTGGQMPSKQLFSYVKSDFHIEKTWEVSGLHYAKTCDKWLQNMDGSKSKIMPIFRKTYGKEAKKFWIYWRLFFMACEELFAFNNGNEWQVYHYLFSKKNDGSIQK